MINSLQLSNYLTRCASERRVVNFDELFDRPDLRYSTDRTRYKIVKMLMQSFPDIMAPHVHLFKINAVEKRVKLAKICALAVPRIFLQSIRYFHIPKTINIANLVKICFTYSADTLLTNLRDCRDESELVNLLNPTAKLSPDLVLERIHEFTLSQPKQDEIMLTALKHGAMTTSDNVKLWVDNHNDLLSKVKTVSERVILSGWSVSPNAHINELFAFFTHIAESPYAEILGRLQWNANEGENRRQDELAKDPNFTRCGATSEALLIAILGKEAESEMNFKADEASLNNIWKILIGNEANIKNLPPSNFFCYCTDLKSLNHCFLIIQYLDGLGKIKYRLLQSWIFNHTLKQYLNRRARELNSDEFAEFYNLLREVLLGTKEIKIINDLFKKYFMFYSPPVIYLDKNACSFQWGLSNIERVRQQRMLFDEWALSDLN